MNIEDIESNWAMFEKLCKRISDQNINLMIDALGERLSVSPASTRTDQYNAHPGGLVKHSLDVTSNLRSMNDAHNLNLPIRSIILVGLLHDIGKVGDLNSDHFIPQDSDWHREKLGQMFKYNENLNKMSVSHRSLFLLQSFHVKLTQDEWIAIQLASGPHFEENRFYVGHEPTLALALQQAKSLTVHQFKNSNS